MLKFGRISEVDVANGLARVYFEDEDFVSAPLKMAVMRSGKDKFNFPFDINEHVYCMMDENMEYGVVCGAVYDEQNLPDSNAAEGVLSLSFDHNSTIVFNRKTGDLTLDIKGKVNIKCAEANIESTGNTEIKASKVAIIATNTTITGALTVSGVVSMGGISGVDGASVNGSQAEISIKKLTASEDVSAGGKSLKSHTHTSAASGSPTSPPL